MAGLIGTGLLVAAILVSSCFCVSCIQCMCRGYHPVSSFLALMAALPITAVVFLLWALVAIH
jgi:hypothetical protein